MRFTEKSAGCWLWTASLRTNGYGQIREGGKSRRTLQAHRAMYEALVGPIPEGMELDHLCRNRACVNPAHLEPVTRRENHLRSPITVSARRKAQTHCIHGHSLADAYVFRGRRGCRTCNLEYGRRKRSAMRMPA